MKIFPVKNCKLVEICAELKDDFRELAAEGITAGEIPYINWNGDFEDYLERMQILAKGENIPADEVPRNTYFLFCDGKIIGRSEIRRELNDELKTIGGHIGGDVRPSERRKGFATLMLEMTLEKARDLGLKRVLLTCDADNIGSAKTIEKCGGKLEKQITDKATGAKISHYWIDL